MEEIPNQNASVPRLKVAILPDLPSSGLVTHTGEILTNDKSHKKKMKRLLPKMTRKLRRVLQTKYATRNIRGLGEKDEELDKNLNENIIISVITESTKKLQGTKETDNFTVIYKEFTDTTEVSWELRYGCINIK